MFELLPIGTEGREPDWLMAARNALEHALQDSFDELDQAPWVVQFFCQDDNDFVPYLTRLTEYIQDSARGTVFTEAYFGTQSPSSEGHRQAGRSVRGQGRHPPALAWQ
nr:hypothetical protein GCM10020185_00980 [Pseudomonas brassicacearum subsp. brassicacearum]